MVIENKNKNLEVDVMSDELSTEGADVKVAADKSLEESFAFRDSMPFIIGKKIGMVRIFDVNGTDFPATVISAGPCIVTQIKTVENDGYIGYQLGLIDGNAKMNKPIKGHVNKASNSVHINHFREVRVESLEGITLGSQINAQIFEVGDLVNVKGASKGRGFAGHMKRHNFSGGRKSHGKNSVMRKAGSIGAGTDPGKVWKGTRMAGQMGNDYVTIKNLEVIRLDIDNNLIFIKGSVPGANNGLVYMMK